MRTTFELFDFLIYTQSVFSFEICKYFMTWSSFRFKNCWSDLIYVRKSFDLKKPCHKSVDKKKSIKLHLFCSDGSTWVEYTWCNGTWIDSDMSQHDQLDFTLCYILRSRSSFTLNWTNILFTKTIKMRQVRSDSLTSWIFGWEYIRS